MRPTTKGRTPHETLVGLLRFQNHPSESTAETRHVTMAIHGMGIGIGSDAFIAYYSILSDFMKEM